ncbi:MAG: Crp/Fnr family transcriptional regulator [Sphingomonadales bacterium]
MGRHREELLPVEVDVLENAVGSVVTFGPRQDLVRHGDPVERSMLLVEGFICRYMDGLDGDRQLVALHVPGDFVDLHGYPMRQLDHDVATITACTVATFPHDVVERMVIDHPNLGRLLWFSTLLDAAMHREWIFRLGRLGASGRVAHLFSELGCRLQMVGLSDGLTYGLPLHQSDIASACGITTVHTNRILRELRERGVVTFSGGEIVVQDIDTLYAIGEFDPRYLYPSPR